MGEHPPLLTPQGPGVPRARRPEFPRVEDSGTSCSPFVIFRLLIDLSLFCRLRFCFLPLDILLPRSDTSSSTGLPALVAQVFPSVSFPFLASGSLHFVPHFSATQVHSLPPTRVYLCSFFLALPFLASSSSDFVAAAFPSTDVPAFPRSPFESRFYRPSFGARLCGPRVAPKRPHTTPPERQRTQGRDRLINLSRNKAQSTGKRGPK